jgi:hypothetical protein
MGVCNMSRARDLGSSINSPVAGKNALINGGCDIWQRGTSFPSGVGLGQSVVYSADRWHWYRGGNDTGSTLTRQSAGLTGFNYCMRIQRNSGNTSTQTLGLRYTLETADSLRFAGKTITFSFYARKGSDYSATGSLFRVFLPYGTGTDQVVHSFTGFTQALSSSTVTLTSTWTRFTFTGSIPSNATEIGLEMFADPTGTAGVNDYMEITGLQLEEGSVATTFSRAGGDIQGELAKCQRYYYQTDSYAIASYSAYNSGNFVSSAFAFPVTMRIAPSISVSDIPGNTNRMTQYPLGGSAVSNITPPSSVNIRTTHWFYEAGGTSNGSQGNGGAFAVRYIASAEL